VVYRMLSTSPISAFTRRLVMPSRGQRCWASGLRLHHPKDLLQNHNTGTEEVTIVLDDVAQLADQCFGLVVCQVKVHAPDMGALTSKSKRIPNRRFSGETASASSPRPPHEFFILGAKLVAVATRHTRISPCAAPRNQRLRIPGCLVLLTNPGLDTIGGWLSGFPAVWGQVVLSFDIVIGHD
jgi:hypothetical protein